MAERKRISWADVEPGQTVWIDNYEDGAYPNADPRVSGPFTVYNVTNRRLKHPTRGVFAHTPDNLLVEDDDEHDCGQATCLHLALAEGE